MYCTWNWLQIAALNPSYKLGRRGDAIEFYDLLA